MNENFDQQNVLKGHHLSAQGFNPGDGGDGNHAPCKVAIISEEDASQCPTALTGSDGPNGSPNSPKDSPPLILIEYDL